MKEIEEMAKEKGQDFSNVTKDLLEEAIKMKSLPRYIIRRRDQRENGASGWNRS